MKTSMYRRVFTIAFLSVFIGAYASDGGKNKRKKEKQEMKCCNKSMEKECAKETKEAAKRDGKVCCDKKTR